MTGALPPPQRKGQAASGFGSPLKVSPKKAASSFRTLALRLPGLVAYQGFIEG